MKGVISEMKEKGIKIGDIMEANNKMVTSKKYISQCSMTLGLVCTMVPQAKNLVVIPVELDPEDEDYYEKLEKECEIFWNKINSGNNDQIDLTEDTWKESGEEG